MHNSALVDHPFIFDVTVTDIDPDHNFAGAPDGASIQLLDQGPADLIAIYDAIFDKDAPNFGLIPPPQVAPYIGHFNIEIPLLDLNGNGIDLDGDGNDDSIKFTIASHAVGDDNRVFETLPDGTVIDQFDSAAFLEGEVCPGATFTVGAGSPEEPNFSGPGAMSGPTSATSTLLTPVIEKDPGFSYVDANNNGFFEANAGDVALIGGELDDGFFDTDMADLPSYPTPIDGAGLVINGESISAANIDFSADRRMIVNTDLTATNGHLLLTSRTDNVELDDPTLHGRTLLEINAARDILSTDDVLRTSGSESVIRLTSGDQILLTGTSVTAMKEVEMDAVSRININPSVANLAVVTATPNIFGRVDLDADFIDVSDAQIDANRDLVIDGSNTLVAVGSQLTANSFAPGAIDLESGFIDLTDAQVNARKQIVIQSGDVIANGSTIQAAAVGSSTLQIDALASVFVDDATLAAAKSVSINAGTDIQAGGSVITATPHYLGSVSLNAVGSIGVSGAITATKEIVIDAGGELSAVAVITANGHSQARIEVHAADAVRMMGAEIIARHQIIVESDTSTVDLDEATVQAAAVGASTVEINAALSLLADSASISAAALVAVAADSMLAPDVTLTAEPHVAGKVDVETPGPIFMQGATINATKDVDIDAGGLLAVDDAVIRSTGQSDGTIDLDAGSDMHLDGATLHARKTIELEAFDSVFAADSKLLAQGNVFSEVRVVAGVDIDLTDATVRARALVELCAGGMVDLTGASIAITHLGSGDIRIKGSTSSTQS